MDSSFEAPLLVEMRAATAQQLETVVVVRGSEHLAAVQPAPAPALVRLGPRAESEISRRCNQSAEMDGRGESYSLMEPLLVVSG